LRHTVTSKTQRTIQCESFNEFKLVLCLDRDPTVADYLSQPEIIHYLDEQGRQHRYTPDFKVWRTDGKVELHEVTVTERRKSKQTQQRREAAAHTFCETRNWSYHVHTETTLPNNTQMANLSLLFGYRPTTYANPKIEQVLYEQVRTGQRTNLAQLTRALSVQMGLPMSHITPVLLHLLWHGDLQANLEVLLYIDASPNPAAMVWRGQ